MYHPIPRRKVPSMGGCLFILAIMGFCVYGWYLHTHTPAIWYHRGRRRPRRRAYENRRMFAANRNRLVSIVCVNRRQILRLVTVIDGNRQPLNGGETSGGNTTNMTAATPANTSKSTATKCLQCLAVALQWKALGGTKPPRRHLNN